MKLPARLVSIFAVLAMALTLGLVSSGSASAATTLGTQVSMAGTPSRITYGRTVTISGQVTTINPSSNTRQQVPVGSVVLQRLYRGTSTWVTVASDASAGSYSFSQPAQRNVYFRVLYSGGSAYGYNFAAGNSGNRYVGVARALNDRGIKRSGNLYITGRLSPAKRGTKVIVQIKRGSWKRYKSVKTPRTGRYKVRVYPKNGARGTKYRVVVKGNTTYAKAVSGTYVARRY